jgi:hypothetical protein
MNVSTRPLALLTLAALTLLALATAARPRAAAAPRDALDWPVRLSVGGASEVYVAMDTDTLDGGVVRLAGNGAWLGRWPVAKRIADIAAGQDGRVYTGLADTGQVLSFGPDGAGQAMWVVSGTVKALAVGPDGRSPGGSVYVLAAPAPTATPAPGQRLVLRRSPAGEPIAAWPVDDTAYDLAAGWLPDDAGDGLVFVADAPPLPTPRIGGTSRLAIYAVDGTPRKAVEQRYEIRGLGVWPLHQAGLGVTPELSPFSLVDWVDADGVSANQFPLTEGALYDLAVDPANGDVWVILGDAVVHFAADGRPLGRITRAELNRRPTATPSASPTKPSPSPVPPSPTAEPTGTATSTELATLPATASATAATSATPTPTEPATQTPRPERWLAYLPYAARGVGIRQ